VLSWCQINMQGPGGLIPHGRQDGSVHSHHMPPHVNLTFCLLLILNPPPPPLSFFPPFGPLHKKPPPTASTLCYVFNVCMCICFLFLFLFLFLFFLFFIVFTKMTINYHLFSCMILIYMCVCKWDYCACGKLTVGLK
jgi:hypothetical protein